MKIGVDIDDTLVEFTKKLIEFYNSKKNTSFEFERLNTWKFEEVFDLSLEEVLELIREFYFSPELSEVGFVEGAKESLIYLSKKHNILFITARHLDIKDATSFFIDNHFKDHFEFELIFSSDEWNDGKVKHEICVEKEVDLIIEDRLEYALPCSEKGIKVILLDRSWNQCGTLPENVIRVNNWKEILEKIGEIENGN